MHSVNYYGCEVGLLHSGLYVGIRMFPTKITKRNFGAAIFFPTVGMGVICGFVHVELFITPHPYNFPEN